MSRAVMMVPTSEYNNLVNHYKGSITENTLLGKAGRLAAEKDLVLRNKRLPDDLAVAVARGKSRQLNRLTRRIRTGSVSDSGGRADTDEDPDAMLYGPVENLLKQIQRQTKRQPAQAAPPPPPPPRRRQRPALSRAPKKKTPVSKKKTTPSLTQSVKKGAWSSIKKKLGFKSPSPPVTPSQSEGGSDDDDDDDEEFDSDGYETPKGAVGGKKKTPRALKRIQTSSGWVDWKEGEIQRKHPLKKKSKSD